MAATLAAALIGIASVIDGDTLEIHGQRIRLWGVDSPEKGQVCVREGEPWRCGSHSANTLDEFIGGRTVSCEAVDTDRYQRVVARCEVGGVSLNAWLVVNGLAVEYAQYSKGAYTPYQSQAQEAHRGVWASQFEMPWEWRRKNK